jgi:hypothetical protein
MTPFSCGEEVGRGVGWLIRAGRRGRERILGSV